MRGSPLIRLLFLTLALIATGLGLMHITSAKPTPEPAAKSPEPIAKLHEEANYRLVLSAAAKEITIAGNPTTILPKHELFSLNGVIAINPQNPQVSLLIRWQTPAAGSEQRFAKLTLEIPGQETFTHVFDSDGDIDDLVELPVK